MSDQAKRFNYGKIPLHLLEPVVLLEIGKVLGMGAKKYGDNNWKTGLPFRTTAGSLLRHLLAWMDGENNDQESGHNHLAHVICNALFLLYFQIRGAKYARFDDRLAGELNEEAVPKEEVAPGNNNNAAATSEPFYATITKSPDTKWG